MELYKFPCKLLPKEPFVDYPAFVGSFIFVGNSALIFSYAFEGSSVYVEAAFFCRQPCLFRQICLGEQNSFFILFLFFPSFLPSFLFFIPFSPNVSPQFFSFLPFVPTKLSCCLQAMLVCLDTLSDPDNRFALHSR